MTPPIVEDLHRKVYEAASQPKALDMGSWHTCGTTHCRAGWIVAIAGEAGFEYERAVGGDTAFAAMQIAKASGAPISPVRFFDTDADALADMKRMAGL